MATSSSGECQKCKPGTIDGSVARSLAHIDPPPDPATPCETCPAGTYAAAGSTGCQDCAVALRGHSDHDFDPGTPCEPCARGRFATTRDGGIQSCDRCPEGRTSRAGSAVCDRSAPQYYGYAVGGACHSCAGLALPRRLAVAREDLQRTLQLPGTCRGGLPGVEAAILPLEGVWVHADAASGRAELVGCQTARACTAAANGTAWLAARNASAAVVAGRRRLAAECGDGFGGFLCGACADGFEKVDGECVECDGYDAGRLLSALLVLLVQALWLLQQSTKPVVSANEVRHLWSRVDTHERGRLRAEGVAAVLAHLGAHLSPAALADAMTEMGVDKNGFVSVDSFLLEQRAKAPTQAQATAVFFVQTLGLVMSSAGLDVLLLDLASLDFEKTVGKCISPHSTVDRFYAKVILTPTILALATALLAPPLWNLLRRRLPAKLWNKLQAPPRATCVHVRRALLNVCRRPRNSRPLSPRSGSGHPA